MARYSMRLAVCSLVFALGMPLTAHAEPASADALWAQTLNNAQGVPTPLKQYRGTLLVVNFWATWCAPCRAEIPELNRFQAAQAGKVQVIGIALEDDTPEVQAFIKAQRMAYPVLFAGDAGYALMKPLGNPKAALPFTLFIDRDGRVVSSKLGLLKPADLKMPGR